MTSAASVLTVLAATVEPWVPDACHEAARAASGESGRIRTDPGADGACLGRVLGFRHILLAASPDLAARQKMVREIVALAATTRDPILRLRAHLSAMVDALDAGDVATADEERLGHERLARELRAPRQIMMSSGHRAMGALLDGRLDEVPALADAALADSDAVRWRGGPQAWGVVMIALAIKRGDVPPGRRRSRRSRRSMSCPPGGPPSRTSPRCRATTVRPARSCATSSTSSARA